MYNNENEDVESLRFTASSVTFDASSPKTSRSKGVVHVQVLSSKSRGSVPNRGDPQAVFLDSW